MLALGWIVGWLLCYFWEGSSSYGNAAEKDGIRGGACGEEGCQSEKGAVQDKMKVVGSLGSILSVCMYVSYIPQIIGNLSGHPGDWIQPSVAFINCTIWVTYGFFKQQRDWPIVIANAPGIVFGLTTAWTALLGDSVHRQGFYLSVKE